MNIELLLVIFAGILGLLVGSFTNVLIWRLPRHESIAFPPSHCPNCDHPLAPKDLVPLFSWLALGGKCRYCKAPIKARYPIVEAISGVAYAVIALTFPFSVFGAAPIGLMLLFTILLAGSAIDLDTYTLPDELTLTGVLLGLLFGFLNERSAVNGLPHFAGAVQGALLGAGILVTIDLIGSWVLRRFRERRFPDFPIGYQQISLGLLAGAWLGPVGALGAALLSAAVNFFAKKVVPIPELVTLGGFLVSLALSSSGAGGGVVKVTQNSLEGAGAVALLAGVYWFLAHRGKKGEEADSTESQNFDPSAMGFGDVKLAAAIGAFLGWQNLLLAVLVAVFAGAVFGLIQKATRADNRVKFGPYLALGAVVAMLWGERIIDAYRASLGM
ncbi:A24 family peptidase [Deinococcus sp.]|uniref:prepilin peptidase n=1 Tax=Deinococcus sp. TaxID=47478 RepID=UPI0025C17FF8|nr:A24 family peptidase [Deinococcus sp.]